MDNADPIQGSVVSLPDAASPVEPKSSSKAGVYSLIIILVVIILGLGGTVVYLLFFKETDTDDTNGNNGETVSLMCTYDGTTYDDGESFPATDGCNTCTCSNSQVSCTEMVCDMSSAESCIYEGVSYTEGQVVYLTEDRCNVCTCQNGEIVCTDSQCQEESYDGTYFSLFLPDGWTYIPVERAPSEGVKVTKGDLFVYVLSTEGSAGGAVGGRMSDVTSLLIDWPYDGANCIPIDAEVGSGSIGTSTAIHTLSISSSSPAYVFEACGLDSSRTYFLGGYVNNPGDGGFFVSPEFLIGTPSSSASRLFLIAYGYAADTASDLPTVEEVAANEIIDDVSMIIGLIRVK